MGEIAWHRRETRRQTENTNFTLSGGKNPAYSPELSRLLEEQGMEAAISFLRNQKSNPLPGLWDKNDFAARQAWNHIKMLSPADISAMKSIAERQLTLAGTIPDISRLSLSAIATAPFTTGLGNEHPLENGFAFLNPYGLPYLPGSGVKGVLRQAARELASGDWGDRHGWAPDRSLSGVEANAADFDSGSRERSRMAQSASCIDALFGRESADGDSDHLCGALSFWDVIPQIKGDSLMVEIMTPHQTHYYQPNNPAAGSTSPHDSGQPIPISYLTVPPGSGFTFHVVCDLAHLERIAPELARDGAWKTLLTAAFEHAFAWCGFGAKTAVGYGAMESETRREVRKQQAERQYEAEQQKQAELWDDARIKFNTANGTLSVEKSGKSALALAPKGLALLESLPPDLRKKVRANQFVKVKAYVAGKDLVGVAP